MLAEIITYINQFDEDTQKKLLSLHTLILQSIPDASQHFAYGMPAYKNNGKPLIYFAAFKQHIGIYATPQTHDFFKEALAQYKQGKGSVQFPHKEELPLPLIQKMLLFKAEENRKKKK